MLSLRFPRGGPRGPSDGPPPWMAMIHAANRIEKIFGEPTSVGPREGFTTVEEYPDADVMFPADDPLTVKIVAKTERGDRVLKAAADALEAEDALFLRQVQKRQENEAALRALRRQPPLEGQS